MDKILQRFLEYKLNKYGYAYVNGRNVLLWARHRGLWLWKDVSVSDMLKMTYRIRAMAEHPPAGVVFDGFLERRRNGKYWVFRKQE